MFTHFDLRALRGSLTGFMLLAAAGSVAAQVRPDQLLDEHVIRQGASDGQAIELGDEFDSADQPRGGSTGVQGEGEGSCGWAHHQSQNRRAPEGAMILRTPEMYAHDPNDVDPIRAMVEKSTTPVDVAAMLEALANMHESNQFLYGNCDLPSFLRGLSAAVQEFEGDPEGPFVEIVNQGPWRVLAEIINMALVID